MKRLSSSDSLGALIPICPATEQHSPENHHVCPREFQSMLEVLDEEGCVEETGQIGEKKRRLNVDQVKALEKNFEVENKLEPERKLKLAQELGLQPRQVAVWFQNRRARWKTKQLERDFGILKANYDSLKHSFESLQHDNQSLLSQIQELKSKLHDENSESNDASVKEEVMVSETENKDIENSQKPPQNSLAKNDTDQLNYKSFTNNNGVLMEGSVFPDFKDGSSDSDSSAILNEENNSPNNAAISSSGGFQNNDKHQFIVSNESSMLKFNCSSSSSSSMNFFHFSDSKSVLGDAQKEYQPQFVKIEEHNFFSGDESCNFFSDEQAPTLQWYCADHWT